MEFEKFNKIPRFNREIIVTEKIDGTNASVVITEDDSGPHIAQSNGLYMMAGSRNRFITPENDNFNFAAWVRDNAEELFKFGPGWHRGEWWGAGIQRRYGQSEKRFTMFNPKWDEQGPECVNAVPVLWSGDMSEFNLEKVSGELRDLGSIVAPGFMNPEGIVIYHTKAGTYLKYTLDGDAMKTGSHS